MTKPQHALWQSILLHLFPGVIGTIGYLLAAPILAASGYPETLALLLAAGLLIMPLELGVLFTQARRQGNGRSLKDVVLYRQPLPKWQFVAIPLALIVWGFLASGITGLFDTRIFELYFGWLPGWFAVFDASQLAPFTRPALWVTFWVGLMVNGLMLPVVEELYFRGYLLPRIDRFGRWSPLINVSLFSLYHFWTPWQFISRIVLVLPWVYTTWAKRNIYLMMITHCAANTLGWILFWASVLG